MDPVEANLPAALPLAAGVPATPLAPRRLGCDHEWYAAWFLLPRLLLDADGPAVRWRIDEPIVDWRARPARADRKNPSLGRPHEPCDRRCTDCVGSYHARQHVNAASIWPRSFPKTLGACFRQN